MILTMFKGTSIKQKLIRISMPATIAALFLIGSILSTYNLIALRNKIIQNAIIHAKIIGDNCTASLSFNNPKDAEETLLALREDLHAVYAAVYTKEGKIFAKYQRDKNKNEFAPPLPQDEGYHFGFNHLKLFQPVMLENERIGTIFIQADLKEFHSSFLWLGVSFLIGITVSLYIAFFLLSRLQQEITNPIHDLTQLMHTISKEKNYSVRSGVQQRQDELGTLSEGFNEMLEQIQTRDMELESHRRNLEKLVDGRTVELATANVQLERDFIELKQAEEALKGSEEKFRRLVENLRQEYFFYRHGTDGVFTYLSPSITEVLGYSQEEFLKHYSEHLTDNPINKQVEHHTNLSIQGIQQPPFEVEIYHKDGGIRRLEVTESPVFDNKGSVVAVEGLAHDITERKRMEEELKALSLNDGLTGLYNRRGFITLAEQQLKFTNRMKRGMVLLFADLDDLKLINDSFGHQGGDQALIDTAYLLKNTFRGSDIIARIGGDEFVVLALDTHETYCEVLISRLKKNISIHNTKEGRPYKLMLSVGTAYYDSGNPCSIEQLLERADKMMYEEKQRKSKI